MSEETLLTYRLTSLETPTQSPELRWNPLMYEEPTDEMLHAIMEKVAVAVCESTERVQSIHNQRLAKISAMRRNRNAQI